MPVKAWSAKRERQYEHIKEGLEERGGLRSHSGSGGRTYDQLRNDARERGIKGRSTMSKAQLERALGR
jgi:hypothetical protein